MNKHYDNYEDVSCTTVITDEKDGYYAFADTVFFGEKGGQDSDQGWINGLEVLDLRWEDDTLYHKVDGKLSDPIDMTVDFATRNKHTQVQSALHLLDGFYEDKGLTLIAVGAKPDHQWYELDSKEVSQELLDETEAFMAEVIQRDFPTEFSYMNGADYPDPFYQQFQELRLVKFADINTQPCGTPHVNHSGQIGSFAILGTEKTKKGTKVHIAVGDVIRDRVKEYYQGFMEATRLLNTNADQTLEKLSELLNLHKQQDQELKALKEELMSFKAKELANNSAKIVRYETDQAGDLQVLGQTLLKAIEDEKVILAQIQEVIYVIILSKLGKARDLFAHLKEIYSDIKGGGSPQIVTGRLQNEDIDQVQEVLKDILG